jgi:hypothetical protein
MVLAAILVGLDNPTGIILGWIAVIVALVALARKWRNPWYFLVVLATAFCSAIFLAFIYMVIAWPLAKWIGGPAVDDNAVWHVFYVIMSNLILLAVPMSLLFGALGFIVTGIIYLFNLARRPRAIDGA